MSNNTTFNFLLPESECYILRPFGVYLIILFIISLTCNLSVISAILKHKKDLLKHINILTLANCIFGLIETLIGIPIYLTSLFSCK